MLNHPQFMPIYDNAIKTMTEIFSSKFRICNQLISQLNDDLGEAMGPVLRLQRSVPFDQVTFEYVLEWNVSFRDNIKNIRSFIPTFTINIVRIEYTISSRRPGDKFLRSRVIVAEFSCLFIKKQGQLTKVDSEVRVFDAPSAGIFEGETKKSAFLGQRWGKLVIFIGALLCAKLDARQEVFTISDESRGIYKKYFQDFKSSISENKDHFELLSSDDLCEHIEKNIKTVFQEIEEDTVFQEMEENPGTWLKYGCKIP